MLTRPRIVSDRYKNWAIRFMPLLLIRGVVSACGFPAWRDQALREVAEGRWLANSEQVPPGSAPSQTIEFCVMPTASIMSGMERSKAECWSSSAGI